MSCDDRLLMRVHLHVHICESKINDYRLYIVQRKHVCHTPNTAIAGMCIATGMIVEYISV